MPRIYCVLLVCPVVALAAAEPSGKQIAADKQALSSLQDFVGEWKGVGQPKRGSSDGAWTEQAAWAWHFDKDRAELRAEITDAKYYRQLQLRPTEKPDEFQLIATPAGEGEPDRFSGALDKDKQLVLTAQNAQADRPARISFRLVAGGDRLIVLYERRTAGNDYARLAEVGATRKGSAFANAAGYPECVVTGGRGTIAVEHQGKTYYVCCTGCRDAFREDPETVLAEYRERKAEEQAARTKGAKEKSTSEKRQQP